jgi:hypothetical protein
MHYQGMLRVVRREKGIRIYGAHKHERAPKGAVERRKRIDALVDAVVRIYAPLPAQSLSYFVRRLRFAAPQWRQELTSALQRAKQRLSHARIDGVDWYWLATEDLLAREGAATERHLYDSFENTMRLVTPFDPLVNDRERFELLWGWTYRFEAYTPASKRKLGYYAMPLLWRDRIIGWANISVSNGKLIFDPGYVSSPPRERGFKGALDEELDRMKSFLRL